MVYAHVLGFILLGNIAVTNRLPFIYDSWLTYVEILVFTLTQTAALILLLIAYQQGNPSITGMFLYLGIVYSFLVDFLFFELNLNKM